MLYFYVHSFAEFVIFLALLYLSSKSFLLSISLSTFLVHALQHLSSFSLQLSHLHLIYPPQKKIYDIEYKPQYLIVLNLPAQGLLAVL